MNPDEIVKLLPVMAGKYPWLNAVMHVLAYATLAVLLLTKFKQKGVVFDMMVTVLTLCVAVVSITSGNPFNFITFLVLWVLAVIELFKARNVIAKPAWNVKTAICLAITLFGIWYPHFVEANAAMMLLVSPMGALPCPTLTVLLALMNLYHPKVHKGLFTAMTILGLFYGVTGVFMMKVYFDIPLLLITLYSVYRLKFLFRKGSRTETKEELPA